jgi:hypothetical protein
MERVSRGVAPGGQGQRGGGATARAVDGAGHAAPFDATANFVRLVAENC